MIRFTKLSAAGKPLKDTTDVDAALREAIDDHARPIPSVAPVTRTTMRGL